MTWLRVALHGCLAGLVLAGCAPERTAQPQTESASVSAAIERPATEAHDRHELGRKIWNFRCYYCHGYSGDARTLAATYLHPPPRDFTAAAARALTVEAMVQAVTRGKPGTAMKGFSGILDGDEIAAVTAFVRREFIEARAENTRYHTAENGWPDHERHRDAYGFARGQVALDTPWEQLDDAQRRGKRLYLNACVTCHDHGRVDDPGAIWQTRAVSYPRDAYCTSCHERADGSGARPDGDTPAGHPPVRDVQAGARPSGGGPAGDAIAQTYRVHDRKPKLPGLSALERRGEAIYQRDCAFCHAADGTAKSWIGRFLEPPPRDLTDGKAMAGMTRQRLVTVIENGLEGTSMPAWKHVLKPVEIDALVAYIHRAFHPVPGA